MKKIISLLVLFPFYITAVIITSIFILPLSFCHMIGDKAFFNPLKLGWYYFNGKKYYFSFDEKDFIPMFISFISLMFIVLFTLLFISEWKIMLFLTSIVLFAYFSLKFGSNFVNMAFLKKK